MTYKPKYHHCDICSVKGKELTTITINYDDSILDLKRAAREQDKWEPLLPMTVSTFLRHLINDLIIREEGK